MALPAINVLSLCSGAGGIELGLKLALGERVRTVCYVEREAHAAACLVARMEDSALDDAPVWDCLDTFDGSPWRGVVDCVTAGYPCQPYSVAGKRRGHADERDLWPHVARIIDETRPAFVFLENVPAILATWDRERGELQGMGYAPVPGLFSAHEVGASQKRLRLFALADASSNGLAQPRLRQTSCTARDGLDAIEPFLLSAWPPGPCEVTTIPRVADGMAYRVDRLQLCGNGVVPLVAAYAFCTLLARIRTEGTQE